MQLICGVQSVGQKFIGVSADATLEGVSHDGELVEVFTAGNFQRSGLRQVFQMHAGIEFIGYPVDSQA